MSETTAVRRLMEGSEAIAENERSVSDYRSGNEKALNALLGPVMKKSRGKANPQLVNKLLRELLA